MRPGSRLRRRVPCLKHEHAPERVLVVARRERGARSRRARWEQVRGSRCVAKSRCSTRSPAHSRRGPRSQSPSGTPKPILGRSNNAGGTCFARTWRKIHLPWRPRTLSDARKSPREFDHAMVEQRDPSLQGHRHARAIDLREDVVRQVRDEIAEHHRSCAVERPAPARAPTFHCPPRTRRSGASQRDVRRR